jgi:hypothetical protein
MEFEAVYHVVITMGLCSIKKNLSSNLKHRAVSPHFNVEIPPRRKFQTALSLLSLSDTHTHTYTHTSSYAYNFSNVVHAGVYPIQKLQYAT